MPELYLNSQNGSKYEEKGYYLITYEVDDCRTNKEFKRLLITCKYEVGYWMWYWRYFNLYIYKFQGDSEYISYCPDSYGNAAIEIEAIFSKIHPDRPLVLGFKINSRSYFQYFSYDSLKGKSWNYPPNGEIEEDGLNDLLQKEDTKFNKKITFKLGPGQNRNIKKIPKSDDQTEYVGASKEFQKVTYLPDTDKKSGGNDTGPWQLYSNNLVYNGKKEINQLFLDDVKDRLFYTVVEYYKVRDSMLLLVELIENFYTRIYFARKIKNGAYWEKLSYKDDAIILLQSIVSDVKNNVTYLIGETESSSATITVIKEQSTNDYSIVTHTLDDPSYINITYVLYKDTLILTNPPDELKNKKFISLKTYSIMKDDKPYPLVICLTEESSVNTYYRLTNKQDEKEWSKEGIDRNCVEGDSKIKKTLNEIYNELNKFVVVDMDQKTNGRYSSGLKKITIDVIKTTSDVCDQFEKIVHNVQKGSFNISSLKSGKNCVCITNNVSGLKDVSRVIIYFFKYLKDVPLLADIQMGDSNLCYKNIIQTAKGRSYNLTDLETYDFNTGSMSCDSLKRELFMTYHLDKEDAIYDGITATCKDMPEFTVITHRSTKGYASMRKYSYLLYKDKPITNLDTSKVSNKKLTSVHGRYYDYIKTFSLKNGVDTARNSDYHKQLFVELIEGGATYFLQKNDKDGTKWKQKDISKFQIYIGNELRGEFVLGLLKAVQYELVEKVVVLIDLKDKYTKGTVQSKVGSIHLSSKQPNSLTPTLKKDFVTLAEKGYKCYGTQITLSGHFCLRRFIDSKEIKLYSDDLGTIQDYIHYKQGEDLFYVYFYGDDPRPLLVCYNNNVFKPQSMKNYISKWIRVNGITNFQSTQNSEVSIRILEQLDQITYYLNRVNLESIRSYNIYTQNITIITINVTGEPMKCYKKYIHSPKDDHKLGEIKYVKDQDEYDFYEGDLPHKNGKILNKVIVYHVYDFKHEFPIFVELELEDVPNQYYKLVKRGQFKWKKISEVIDIGKIEEFIYKIRKDLEIVFDKNNSLFDPKDCYEDDNTAMIAGACAGSIALFGTGTGIVIYKKIVVIVQFLTNLF